MLWELNMTFFGQLQQLATPLYPHYTNSTKTLNTLSLGPDHRPFCSEQPLWHPRFCPEKRKA